MSCYKCCCVFGRALKILRRRGIMLVRRWRACGSSLLGSGTVASAEAVQVNDRRGWARVLLDV